VQQQLIINSSIEKTVLVSDASEGDDLVRGGYPDKVSAIYTPDCFQIGSKFGGLSTIAINVYKGSPRLTADLDSVL
jgi:hypothetical protein